MCALIRGRGTQYATEWAAYLEETGCPYTQALLSAVQIGGDAEEPPEASC